MVNCTTVSCNGVKRWYANGRLHRENGPAIEWPDGHKSWYFNGQPHRGDGPAVEGRHGPDLWCLKGVRLGVGEEALLNLVYPKIPSFAMRFMLSYLKFLFV